MSKEIDGLAENICGYFYGWSLVDKKWISDLKVYLNITLPPSLINAIWTETMEYGIILLSRKLSDQFNEVELSFFEDTLIQKIVHLMPLANNTTVDEIELNKIRKGLEREITVRKDIYSEGDNILRTYAALIKEQIKKELPNKISDEMIMQYAIAKNTLLEKIFESVRV